MKCIICTFEDNQETIIETRWGACHQECLDDQEADARADKYDPQAKLDEEVGKYHE